MDDELTGDQITTMTRVIAYYMRCLNIKRLEIYKNGTYKAVFTKNPLKL